MLLLSTEGLAQGEPKADAPPPRPPEVAYAKPEQDQSWRQDVLVALIGGGVRFRRIHLDVASDTGGTEPRDLDTGAYFDFAWHLFIRPMGHRSPRPAIRAIVLQVDGGSGIGVTVESDAAISLNTNIWRMVGQFGYLYPTDRWQLGGLVGVGGDVLNIDLNSVMPSSRIVYVRIGPAASVDVVDGYLTIRADFGLRFPFHLGELANAFGQDSRAFGLDGTLTFQGRIKAGFTYGVRFVWEYYTYRFRGPVDNVPSMAEGGDGSDHAATLQVLLGWSL
jgi:hypothetical protein